MKSINELHKKLCPGKSLSNFWKSLDYLAAEKVVKDLGGVAREPLVTGTQVHDLVATAFLRWADPDRFYKRLSALL